MFHKLRLFIQKNLNKMFFNESQNQLVAELNDYRETINQHEEELRELYAVLENLKDRQDEQQLLMGNTRLLGMNLDLSNLERRILILLYSSDLLLTARDIAVRIKIPEPMVIDYLETLSQKGIPLLKQQSLNNQIYYALDSRFKTMQAKQNFLRINPVYSRMLMNESFI